MKTTLEVEDQVLQFIQSLAPEPRHRVRMALHKLGSGLGDLKTLEGNLDGYWRLRVGSYRIILRYYSRKGVRICRCSYGERRKLIYEVFSQIVSQNPHERSARGLTH